MERMSVDGRVVAVCRAQGGGAAAPVVLVSNVESRAEKLAELCAGLGCQPFHLVEVSGLDWNRDLSPWAAEPAFPKGEAFAGGAQEYLAWLLERALPSANGALGSKHGPIYLAGYSLAGLFSLWALYQTDAFAGAASASGSLWFPGFADYAESQPFAGSPEAVYLSLGDRESAGKNPLFSQGEAIARKLAAAYAARGLRSTFELNPGNHFTEPDLRLAKAIAWLLG